MGFSLVRETHTRRKTCVSAARRFAVAGNDDIDPAFFFDISNFFPSAPVIISLFAIFAREIFDDEMRTGASERLMLRVGLTLLIYGRE